MTATASAKQPSFTIADWGVTEEKVMQAVERASDNLRPRHHP